MKYIVLLFFLFSSVSVTATPLPTDSRIKTFVYSENEVFRVVVHHGYQTSIEFAKDEEIQTVFLGNNYAWQLTPLGRRLFIKAIEDEIMTNMTIITNQHVYQFEVESKSASQALDAELAYVVRFFYPDSKMDKVLPKLKNYNDVDNAEIIQPFNFNYSLTGPDELAPVKVFDDSVSTYMEFDSQITKTLPKFYKLSFSGQEEIVSSQRGGYVVLPVVSKNIIVKDGKKEVVVFNENYK